MPADLNEQYDKIYRYCYFKVKDAVLAEDLTQETFLKYFAQNSYKDCGKKMAYLYTIARNLCIDSFRRKQVLPLEVELMEENPMKQVEAALVIQQALAKLKNMLKEEDFA